MGLATIIRKSRRKEGEMRILVLYGGALLACAATASNATTGA